MKKQLLAIVLIIGLVSCDDELGKVEKPVNVPAETTLTGTITSPITTLTADKVWTLKGYVYVADGAELKIQPGTTIVSDIAEKGALIIERGGKINAEGTALKPIVFTSAKPVGERAPGDWGGIIVLGKATTNRTTEPTIEGGVGRPYGGTDDLDNSGVLKYVRIEYAGIAAAPNSEINGLTLGAVGSGTTIEYVQTIYANDDAFEFFGGTVSPKYLYAYATADDDYDFDFGFRGTLTNIVSKRDPQFVDSGDAGNGIECDNDGSGTLATPFTNPIIDGAVLIGPNDASALSNHNLAARFRRSTHFIVRNSVFVGYMKGGLSLESDETANWYKNGLVTFINNKVQTFNPTLNFISKSSVITSADVKTKALNEGNTETNFTTTEIESLSKPVWVNSWTRFPNKGY
jgi:hypothetical protein